MVLIIIDLLIRLVIFGLGALVFWQIPHVGPSLVSALFCVLLIDLFRGKNSSIRTLLRKAGFEEAYSGGPILGPASKPSLPIVTPPPKAAPSAQPTSPPAQPGTPAKAPPATAATAAVEGTESVVERAPFRGTAPARPIVHRQLPRRKITQAELGRMKNIGEGGEAVVFRESTANGVFGHKMFRFPDDPFYASDPGAQQNAAVRLAAYAGKLPEFPPWLGSRVVGPVATLHTGSRYAVCGYSMPFVTDSVPLSKYADPAWKRQHGVTLEEIARIFIDLHDTICENHACGMIIGDFKMPNVLVQGRRRAFIVDAESMAYGDYPCRTFTDGFVDPRLCDNRADFEVLTKPYDRKSDWYAFSVMLFHVLTHVMPYDGVYLAPAGKPPVPPAWRSRKSISVFNKAVRLPGFATGKGMPERLKTFFFNVFERGLRERPGRELLAELLGANQAPPPFRPREHTCWKQYNHDAIPLLPATGAGEVTLPSFFSGPQLLVASAGGRSGVSYLTHDGARYLREDGSVVVEDDGRAYNTFLLGGHRTIVGVDKTNGSAEQFDGPFYILEDGERPRAIQEVDPAPDGTPNIAFLGDDVVWVGRGALCRLSKQNTPFLAFGEKPRLYAGAQFGVVVTTSQEELSDLFLFDKAGIVRLTSLPPILGKVKRVQCVFGDNSVWMFFTLLCKGETSRYVLVLNAQGDLQGLAAASDGENAWFSEATLRAAYEVSEPSKTIYELAALTPTGLVRMRCAAEFKVEAQPLQQWKTDQAHTGREPMALVYTATGLQVGLKVPVAAAVLVTAAVVAPQQVSSAGDGKGGVTNGAAPAAVTVPKAE